MKMKRRSEEESKIRRKKKAAQWHHKSALQPVSLSNRSYAIPFSSMPRDSGRNISHQCTEVKKCEIWQSMLQ